jgi:CRP-like cAMP-binding protein
MVNFQAKLHEFILNNGKEIFYKKGDYLTQEGEIENYIYFIVDGAVRAYFVSEHEDYSIRLGYNNNIINSLASFITRQASELYIEALRKTQVLRINHSEFYSFINSDPDLKQAYTWMMEQLVVQQIERELDLLIDSPKERLNRVLKRSPNLFQHIPLKYIASYLRMKPETLSRIRNS